MKRNGPSPWKCFVLFMAFTLGSASAHAQSESLDGIPATEALSKKVTELFSQNKISQAFDALRPYWPLAENEIETYLIRDEYTAIRVKIIYYQNKDGWIVNSFKWDDTFSEEF